MKKQELIKVIYEELRQKSYWEGKTSYLKEYIKAYINHQKSVSQLDDADKNKLSAYIEHCKNKYGYKEEIKEKNKEDKEDKEDKEKKEKESKQEIKKKNSKAKKEIN